MRAFRLPQMAFRKFNRNKLFPPHMLISPRTTTLFHIDLSSFFRSILRRKHWFSVGVLFTASAAHGQWASGFYLLLTRWLHVRASRHIDVYGFRQCLA